MIDLLIEEVAVTMAVGAPDRNGARRRSTFAVQFVQGIQEAIEFLCEQLQFGLHQSTLQIGDVLPLSAEKRTWSDALPLAHKPRGHLSQFSLVKVAR